MEGSKPSFRAASLASPDALDAEGAATLARLTEMVSAVTEASAGERSMAATRAAPAAPPRKYLRFMRAAAAADSEVEAELGSCREDERTRFIVDSFDSSRCREPNQRSHSAVRELSPPAHGASEIMLTPAAWIGTSRAVRRIAFGIRQCTHRRFACPLRRLVRRKQFKPPKRPSRHSNG